MQILNWTEKWNSMKFYTSWQCGSVICRLPLSVWREKPVNSRDRTSKKESAINWLKYLERPNVFLRSEKFSAPFALNETKPTNDSNPTPRKANIGMYFEVKKSLSLACDWPSFRDVKNERRSVDMLWTALIRNEMETIEKITSVAARIRIYQVRSSNCQIEWKIVIPYEELRVLKISSFFIIIIMPSMMDSLFVRRVCLFSVVLFPSVLRYSLTPRKNGFCWCAILWLGRARGVPNIFITEIVGHTFESYWTICSSGSLGQEP